MWRTLMTCWECERGFPWRSSRSRGNASPRKRILTSGKATILGDFVAARDAYEKLLKSLEDGIPVPYIPVEPAPPNPPPCPSPPRRSRPPPDAAVERVVEGRRRRAREAAYLAGQATLEVAYRGYGYWTRAGLPKWRTR